MQAMRRRVVKHRKAYCASAPAGKNGLPLHCRGTADTPTIVIMAKEPVMGRVKTRLGQDIGAVRATYFFRHCARAVMLRLARDSRWRVVLALSPDKALATRAWPHDLARMVQGHGDLGQRMQRLIATAPGGAAILIGTDIPQIRPMHIAMALRQMGANDAVLGAAGDGGYWLVGQSRTPRVSSMFCNVRWSSAHALSDTIANVAPGSVGAAPLLGDVDDSSDHAAVRSWSGRVVLPFNVGRHIGSASSRRLLADERPLIEKGTTVI